MGRLPSEIPEGGDYADELKGVVAYLDKVQQFARALATGDLSFTLSGYGGTLAGSLKALQLSLRHLTWQTKQIAAGDLTQRVDFLGEFAVAFNFMVASLDKVRQELVHLGTHDALTGLNNRAFFDGEMERLAKGRQFPVTLIMADLDGLKGINDNYGQEAGDLLIQRAACVLVQSFRGDDVIVRLGGDEFAIIMPTADATAAADAVDRISMQQAAVNEIEGPKVHFSIGIAVATLGSELSEAFKKADERMYENKAANKVSRAAAAMLTSIIPCIPFIPVNHDLKPEFNRDTGDTGDTAVSIHIDKTGDQPHPRRVKAECRQEFLFHRQPVDHE